MKKSVILSLLIAIATPFLATAQQKLGHTNSDAILNVMPESKQAESQIAALEQQYTNQLKQKSSTFETAYKKYMQETEAGTVSQADAKTREAALQTQYAALQKAQADAEQRIQKKREELFKPIFQKMQSAIDAVAKEKGLTYVFDESAGNFVSAMGSIDITADVKRKLGL